MGFYPAQAQESEVDLANCFDEFPRWSVGLKQNYQLPRCLCNPPRPSIEQQISLNKNQWCIMELNDPMGSNEKVMKLHLGGMSARLLLNRERGKSRTWLDCVATGRGSSQKFFRFQRLTRASWSNFRTHYCLFFQKGCCSCWWLKSSQPVDMVNIPLFTRFYTCQVVVWDFFHQQLLPDLPVSDANLEHRPSGCQPTSFQQLLPFQTSLFNGKISATRPSSMDLSKGICTKNRRLPKNVMVGQFPGEAGNAARSVCFCFFFKLV